MGSPGQWNDARRSLATTHVATAIRFARRLAEVYPWPVDEAESLALVELAEAAMVYENRGGRFSTYLYARLRVAMRRPWRSPAVVVLLDAVPAPEADDGREAEQLEAIRRWLTDLPRDQSCVLELRYGIRDGRERSPAEVGRLVGRRPSWVARTEATALAGLAGRLTGDRDPPLRHRGVRKVGPSWVACLRVAGRTVHLGTFPDPESAAAAVERVRRERIG